ncbi:hypothetical protein C9427_07685 [Mesorhizobium helmanticense]|uniref:Uncharacterized protein n=1 Tax=Mesorhizobium helmanticense TaxID=1776423 RepID=A0A2T4IZL7_9HYPH|nr:hypothetical protein C9427_07685 [Mesorhizobium helmanticense]
MPRHPCLHALVVGDDMVIRPHLEIATGNPNHVFKRRWREISVAVGANRAIHGNTSVLSQPLPSAMLKSNFVPMEFIL